MRKSACAQMYPQRKMVPSGGTNVEERCNSSSPYPFVHYCSGKTVKKKNVEERCNSSPPYPFVHYCSGKTVKKKM